MTDDDLNHIVRKSRDAKNGGFGVLSTSEQLAACFGNSRTLIPVNPGQRFQ